MILFIEKMNLIFEQSIVTLNYIIFQQLNLLFSTIIFTLILKYIYWSRILFL